MKRRDFTINAIARRLSTGEYVDPLDGRADLDAGVLRAVSEQSFREDPLRIVRGLRFVSQLGLEPDGPTRAQMKENAASIALVAPERIGGGLAADGLGELSKLLLGAQPARALRLARDVGVLPHLLPELAVTVGYAQSSKRQQLPLDEHVFAVIQQTADDGARLEVRLAALLHDLGKPESDRTGRDHAEVGAEIAERVLHRLRYPTRLRRHVVAVVREHAFHELPDPQPVDARRFLAEHGDELALDLLAHKAADMRAKERTPDEHAALARYRELVEEARSSPHTLGELAVTGADLIAAGFREGPELGRVLGVLLHEVVERPERNERGWLLERAAEEAR
jgi:tRNA nucleotidyltransferase (CCA-adding enzyme)